jgi:hypothetical protein
MSPDGSRHHWLLLLLLLLLLRIAAVHQGIVEGENAAARANLGSRICVACPMNVWQGGAKLPTHQHIPGCRPSAMPLPASWQLPPGPH